jgi:hypothetical protein
MMAKNGADICDPKVVRHEYEMLRANALGHMNRAPEFAVFLRSGMSAWLRALGKQGCGRPEIRHETSSVFAELDVDMPGADLASILTDAILNAERTARHSRDTT